jgi:hypothetical protein
LLFTKAGKIVTEFPDLVSEISSRALKVIDPAERWLCLLLDGFPEKIHWFGENLPAGRIPPEKRGERKRGRFFYAVSLSVPLIDRLWLLWEKRGEPKPPKNAARILSLQADDAAATNPCPQPTFKDLIYYIRYSHCTDSMNQAHARGDTETAEKFEVLRQGLCRANGQLHPEIETDDSVPVFRQWIKQQRGEWGESGIRLLRDFLRSQRYPASHADMDKMPLSEAVGLLPKARNQKDEETPSIHARPWVSYETRISDLLYRDYLPTSYSWEENEERITMAVCEATGLTTTEWAEKKKHPQASKPYFEKTIAHLQKLERIRRKKKRLRRERRKQQAAEMKANQASPAPSDFAPSPTEALLPSHETSRETDKKTETTKKPKKRKFRNVGQLVRFNEAINRGAQEGLNLTEAALKFFKQDEEKAQAMLKKWRAWKRQNSQFSADPKQ